MDIKNTQRTVQTIECDMICRPKCEGGLAIKMTEDVNAAFLAKQGL